MTILNALLSRVSVSCLEDPAPDGHDLNLILKSGLCAPDHGGLRPWRFVLIRGAARATFAETTIAALRLREPNAPQSMIDRQRAELLGAPLIIALGARLKLGARLDLGHSIPESEQMLSVGAAAMNMLNAAHALGYGGIWVTGANSYDPHVISALGLGSSDQLAGFLFVGTPKGAPQMAGGPKLADHVVEWTGNPALAVLDEHSPIGGRTRYLPPGAEATNRYVPIGRVHGASPWRLG
jgi:nitroreductase